jgi:hypothetical protein
VYTAEFDASRDGGGPLPPWCAARLFDAIADAQGDDVVATFRGEIAAGSGALNAAVRVAAARRRASDDDDDACRYYDASERKRVRDGCDARFDRGFEKITRRHGTYYLRSAFRE